MSKHALRILTLNESEEWDYIVRSFEKYDTYYLSGYVKAFELHGDGEALLFYFNNGDTKGINVVMKRDVADDPHFSTTLERGIYFDITTPYGYGGWLIDGESSDLFKEYSDWCQRNNIIAEFVRFHPMIGNQEIVKDYYSIVPLGETVAMELTSPEVIWENIHSKNRNVIRKAVKNGIKIYNGRYREIYKKFKTVYDLTMDKDNAEDYYYFEDDFYESILEDLPENAQIFWAQKNDDIIAASIMLECNGRMNYHLSGSLREYSSLAPTNLLLYHAALWGCAHGFRSLYLGGGVGSGEDNLFKFKRSFYKGDLYRFNIGKRIFINEVYDELIRLRGNTIINHGYFPEYRG